MERCPELIEEDHVCVVELLDRLLHKGVVVGGDIAISVADVELIYLRTQLLLSSVETARKAGWIWRGGPANVQAAEQPSRVPGPS